jgi:hypothetical protein
VGQLKKERDRLQRQLSGLNAALATFAGVYTDNREPKPRRVMSDRSRSEGTLGESKGSAADSSNQANDVSLGSVQNRGGSTVEVGEAETVEQAA